MKRQTKRCTGCRRVFPLASFPISRGTTRRGDCRECRNKKSAEFYARNLERERKKRREYGRAHRDEYRVRYERAKAADPERMREQQRKAARRRREPLKKAARLRRAWERAAYLDRIAREGKPCSRCKETKPLAEFRKDARYRSGHHSNCIECSKLLDREHTRKRRAWMAGGKVDYDVILARDGMVCHLCGWPIKDRRSLEFDHVVPLSKGGPHSEKNVRPAHKGCNRRKGNR